MDNSFVVSKTDDVGDLPDQVNTDVGFEAIAALGKEVVESEAIVLRVVFEDDGGAKLMFSEAMCPQDAWVLHRFEQLELA